MAKSRAKRLGEFLEGLGWFVFDDEQTATCSNCGHTSFGGKYCSECGHALKRTKKSNKEVLEQLEDAIKYALGE